MKRIITATVLAALALPGIANAQSAGELRRDRQDIREEQRELHRAQRYGTPHDVREQRRDVREARQEYREDLRDRDRQWRENDWREWRAHNRSAFARGRWYAPFRYTRFATGARIGRIYYGPRYVIADPWRYHLPRAGFGRVWVRHYDDMLLVDTRRGIVIRVVPGFFF